MFEIKKYQKVYINRRKNPPRNGTKPTVSYTLEWRECGRRRFQSLGSKASYEYARRAAALKEKEINGLLVGIGDAVQATAGVREPIAWQAFRDKYLATYYPGHDLPRVERLEAQKKWGKSPASFDIERRVMDRLADVINPEFVHGLTTEHREQYINDRIEKVSAATVESELRSLRLILNAAEQWGHRVRDSNPFQGRNGATVGSRRKRSRAIDAEKKKHLSAEQIKVILRQADQEAAKATVEDQHKAHRLRALAYVITYTGMRAKEALHLEWPDVDFERRVAFIRDKKENLLKTHTSEAVVGLAEPAVAALREWQKLNTCNWIFPNKAAKPWTGGTGDQKALDQFKALARRAGIEGATFQTLRHSLATLGKQVHGLTPAQVQSMLRHGSLQTQKFYTHADIDAQREIADRIRF